MKFDEEASDKTSRVSAFSCPQINISVWSFNGVLLYRPTHQHIPATCQIQLPASSVKGRAAAAEHHAKIAQRQIFCRCSSILPRRASLWTQNLYYAASVELQRLSHARASPRIRPVSTQASALSLCLKRSTDGEARGGDARGGTFENEKSLATLFPGSKIIKIHK